MADLLLAVVDVLAEIFRMAISQRYLLLIAGLVWWILHSLLTSEEEEKQRNGLQLSEGELKQTGASSHIQVSSDLNIKFNADDLDYKLDSSHSAGPYIMPLSSNVATDSEPEHYKSQTMQNMPSDTFMKLLATFENAANQNSTTSLPCLAGSRLNQTSALSPSLSPGLSHSNTINSSLSPYYDKTYSESTDLKSYDHLLRPVGPRSLGNSPAVSPREGRRSRSSKRLSVCGKCRTAGKSTSWSEADSQLRGRVKRTPDRDPSPATTVFYCGRYISVSNGKQVQIGDHCNMTVTAAYSEEYDDGSGTDGDSSGDHLDLDSQVVTDSEQDDPFVSSSDDVLNLENCCNSDEECEPLVCSFCRAKMTDDEKSELLPVGDARRPVRSITYPLGIPTADDDVLGNGIARLAETRSASVSTDGGLTPPITDEEKEKLFREAKAKIYAAAQRHRELSSPSPNFERDDLERNSLRTFTFWKRRKQSTDGKPKTS